MCVGVCAFVRSGMRTCARVCAFGDFCGGVGLFVFSRGLIAFLWLTNMEGSDRDELIDLSAVLQSCS